MNNEMMINEGGINWTWFTRIRLEPDDTVTILEYYRKHNSETFTEEEKNAFYNMSVHSNIWEEGKGRVAIRYNVPNLGWKLINNPKYIFDYKKEEPLTKEEAKEIIEQVAEQKKSMIEITNIVETKADEKFKTNSPEYYQIREKIYEEDLFDKLRNKIEEKKKLINYPHTKTIEERKLYIAIQEIEQSLYDTYQVPLYKLGLTENLSNGFEWLLNNIILTYAKLDNLTKVGKTAVQQLFPSEKSYEYSTEAKTFIDFLEAEKEDYKIFSIEFLKIICGEK